MKKLRIILIVLFTLVLALFAAGQVYLRTRIDRVAPVLKCETPTLDVSVNSDEKDLLQGVSATDDRDGNLTDRIMVASVSRLVSADTAIVTYLVSDDSDNMASCTRYLHYTDYRSPTFQLNRALIYELGEPIPLTDRLKAFDVLDGDITSALRIGTMDALSNMPGTYDITVQVTNRLGDISSITLPLTLRLPQEGYAEVRLAEYLIYLNSGSRFDPQQYLVGVYNGKQPLSTSDITITSDVDLQTPGCYRVTYSYVSPSGLTGSAYLTVVVE